jgi:hypothetical protein
VTRHARRSGCSWRRGRRARLPTPGLELERASVPLEVVQPARVAVPRRALVHRGWRCQPTRLDVLVGNDVGVGGPRMVSHEQGRAVAPPTLRKHAAGLHVRTTHDPQCGVIVPLRGPQPRPWVQDEGRDGGRFLLPGSDAAVLRRKGVEQVPRLVGVPGSPVGRDVVQPQRVCLGARNRMPVRQAVDGAEVRPRVALVARVAQLGREEGARGRRDEREDLGLAQPARLLTRDTGPVASWGYL